MSEKCNVVPLRPEQSRSTTPKVYRPIKRSRFLRDDIDHNIDRVESVLLGVCLWALVAISYLVSVQKRMLEPVQVLFKKLKPRRRT